MVVMHVSSACKELLHFRVTRSLRYKQNFSKCIAFLCSDASFCLTSQTWEKFSALRAVSLLPLRPAPIVLGGMRSGRISQSCGWQWLLRCCVTLSCRGGSAALVCFLWGSVSACLALAYSRRLPLPLSSWALTGWIPPVDFCSSVHESLLCALSLLCSPGHLSAHCYPGNTRHGSRQVGQMCETVLWLNVTALQTIGGEARLYFFLTKRTSGGSLRGQLNCLGFVFCFCFHTTCDCE